ncbi:MAG TPA: hypothetical protein VNL14_11000 [Candidatus Acidoferrales bacterium]|nr:hypothetical protein [Candidatus Acidoferrales bacterium]
MYVERYRQENAEPMVGGAARSIPYPKISDDDWRVWNTLLPFRAHTMGSTDTASGSFDLLYLHYGVPYAVSTEIKRAGQYFDRIEIWRARQLEKDPIAVGICGEDRYLIARWGLEKLVPFHVLKKSMPLVLAWRFATSPLAVASLAALGILSLIFVA